jgi:hypothetical protein
MPEAALFAQVARHVRMDPATVAAVLRSAGEVVFENWKRGRRTHFPGVGIIEPIWRDPRVVAHNLPGRPRRRTRIGPRRSAKLRPASRFRTYEFPVGTPVPTQSERPALVFA